jgi:sugar/nucleoside kinase (ribokinase family)
MTHGRVLVVGDLVTDVVAVLSAPLAAGSDTPARVRVTGGGQGANTAAWLAHIGTAVTLVAVVGDDPAGQQRQSELTGVTLAVRIVPGARTGTVVVLSHQDARTMVTDRAAAAYLRPEDIDAALSHAPDTTHLHLSGYLLLEEGSRAAGRHALATARARGLSTSVDAASAAPLRAVGGDTFLQWVTGTDLLLANVEEVDVLGGEAAPAVHAAAGAVVVKQGAAGARWLGPGSAVVQPDAVPVVVVDPTGAGDAFAAGLLSAWLAGADPAAALAAGARLGAEAVQVIGARP